MTWLKTIAGGTMPQFRVVPLDACPGDPTISFEADSVGHALAIIAAGHAGQTVEMWRGDEFIGRLKHIVAEDGSYWRLA